MIGYDAELDDLVVREQELIDIDAQFSGKIHEAEVTLADECIIFWRIGQFIVFDHSYLFAFAPSFDGLNRAELTRGRILRSA